MNFTIIGIISIILIVGIVYSFRTLGSEEFLKKNFSTAAIRVLIFVFSIFISMEIYNYTTGLEKLKIDEQNHENYISDQKDLYLNLISEIEFIVDNLPRVNVLKKYSFFRLDPTLLELMANDKLDYVSDYKLLRRIKIFIEEITKINRKIELKNHTLSRVYPKDGFEYYLNIDETNKHLKDTKEKLVVSSKKLIDEIQVKLKKLND